MNSMNSYLTVSIFNASKNTRSEGSTSIGDGQKTNKVAAWEISERNSR